MADEASFFSRFTTKFVEISAAGIATAVSGYVLAHLTGYMNGAPTMQYPAALQSPAALQVPATAIPPAANLGPVTVPQAEVAAPSTAATSAQPATAQPANIPVAAPQAGPQPLSQPLRAVVATPPAAPLRKSVATDKPQDKPQDTVNAAADNKPRSPDSIEAEVRAALARADAAHAGKDVKGADARPDVKPRPVEATTGAIATRAQDSRIPEAAPRPADLAPKPLDAQRADVSPRSADAAPQSPPARPAPLPLAPAATVEIKSAPVAGVDAAPAPPPDAQAAAQPEEHGLFSAFRNFPAKLRNDQPLPADQAPRPPADVGQ